MVPFLALPAESIERVDVFHVGHTGYIWGPKALKSFPQGTVNSLLDEWLTFDVRRVSIVEPFDIELPFPVVMDGKIAPIIDGRIPYERKTIELTPDTAFPMEVEKTGDGHLSFALRWPPEDSGPRTVTPDAESAAVTPPRVRGELNGMPGAVDVETQQWHPQLMMRWPEPFDVLFGPCAGMDTFHALRTFHSIAAKASSDPRSALAAARAFATPYVSEGQSSLFFARFLPDLAAATARGASDCAVWESYGILAPTAAEAAQSSKLDEIVSVRRAWGGIGLLAALLVDRLEASVGITNCIHCGRVLNGRRNQCNESDDPACFFPRRAADRRRSRRRAKAKGVER